MPTHSAQTELMSKEIEHNGGYDDDDDCVVHY